VTTFQFSNASLSSPSATLEDWDAVRSLLTSCGLPTEGARENLGDFLLAFDQIRLAGCGGLELYPGVALLRSLAVLDDCRGRGLAQELVRRLIARAQARGIDSIALLTTTAADFFARLGFHSVQRSELPDVLRASEELKGACSATAVAMLRRLAFAGSAVASASGPLRPRTRT
jgi:amino-acid N-acetyltransferase